MVWDTRFLNAKLNVLIADETWAMVQVNGQHIQQSKGSVPRRVPCAG